MKVLNLTLLFFIIIFNLFSFGKRETVTSHPLDGSFPSEHLNTGNSINISGRVQIYGNEPHTFVGIVSEDRKVYSVYPQSQEQVLMGLQGYLINFTVVLLDEAQGYGSLFLRDGTVTVISWKIKEQ